MQGSQYHQQVDELRKRAETLARKHRSDDWPDDLIHDLLQQLSDAAAALDAAEAVRRVQHNDLMIAREVAEQERLRYQELFDFAPDAYLVTNRAGIIRHANQAAVILLNVSPQFLTGKPLVSFLPLDARTLFRQQINRVIETQVTQRWEMQLKPRERSLVDVEVSVTYTLHPHTVNQPELRWQLRDISERKRLEAAEREQFFRATFEQMALGMGHIGVKGEWLRVNHRLTEMLGYSADEMAAHTFMDITFADDRPVSSEAHRQLLTGEKDALTLENRYQRKDGSLMWGRVSCSAVRTPNGEFMYNIAVIEDITERLNLERAERERAQSMAVHEERQRLARDLHDAVTQSLFTTSIIAEALPRLWGQMPSRMREQLDLLHRMTRGALSEMRILLMELRPEQLEKADLSGQLQQLADAVRARKHVTVRLNIDHQVRLPPDVHIAFYRIAQESLNNVVKHTRATALAITLRRERNGVELIIHDNGGGFDKGKATAGMGLLNMRERAEAIGARLSVESKVGDGTSVIVRWGSAGSTPP